MYMDNFFSSTRGFAYFAKIAFKFAYISASFDHNR